MFSVFKVSECHDLIIFLLIIYIRKSQKNETIIYTKMFVAVLFTMMKTEIIQTANTHGIAQQTTLLVRIPLFKCVEIKST